MRRGVAVVAILLFAAIAFYWFWNGKKEPPPGAGEQSLAISPSATNFTTPSPRSAPAPSAPQAPAPDAPSAQAANSTNLAQRAGAVPPPPAGVADLPPDVVLQNIGHVIHQYRSIFGGNPVGVNSEITAALKGNNPRQINFIDPQAGMRINANGELVDAWGTPFFFHQLSGTDMEIRSAGPDKKMWTIDDLITR
jgi:hypothetical protein